MKNLENYGVLEMNAKEIREVEGGNPIVRFVAGLIGSFVYDVFSDWDANVAAFEQGYNEV